MLKVETVPYHQVGNMESKQTVEVTLYNHKPPIQTEEITLLHKDENDVHTLTNLVENMIEKKAAVNILATAVPLPKEEKNECVTHDEVRDYNQFLSFEQFWDKVDHSLIDSECKHDHTTPPKHMLLSEDGSATQTHSSGLISKIINKIYIEKAVCFLPKKK